MLVCFVREEKQRKASRFPSFITANIQDVKVKTRASPKLTILQSRIEIIQKGIRKQHLLTFCYFQLKLKSFHYTYLQEIGE